MAETQAVSHYSEDQQTIDRARDFWDKYNRPILIICSAIIILGGAYLAYKYLYKQPLEVKASDAMSKAEEYYRMDSLKVALNGDGINPGFVKVIDKYSGTDAANAAKYYAGVCSLKLGDYAKAAKYLSDFSTDAKQIQARAYKLLGDADAEQGKNADAFTNYKKAAHYFEDDDINSSEYLFTAAYFADRVLKSSKDATDLFKELKNKYPHTERGFDADKYLAQLGVYN